MTKTPLLDRMDEMRDEYLSNHRPGDREPMGFLVSYSAWDRLRREAQGAGVYSMFGTPNQPHAPRAFGDNIYKVADTFGEKGAFEAHVRYLPESEIRRKLEAMGWL